MDSSFLLNLYKKARIPEFGDLAASYEDPQKPAGSAKQQAVLLKAREVARMAANEGGDIFAPKAVFQFMKEQGFPKPPNWCASFVAAVVKGAGLPVPDKPGLATSWYRWGDPVVGDPLPGDIAVADQHGYGHVVIVDKTGNWNKASRAGGGVDRPMIYGLGSSSHHGVVSPYSMEGWTFRRMK
jgi:CHAP domain